MSRKKSNFFGETVAPAFLMGGAAITGYRAFSQIRSNGGISKAWTQAADQKAIATMMKDGQAALHHVKPEEIANMFWHDSVSPGVRSQEIGNLVRSFQLQPQLNAMGLKGKTIQEMSGQVTKEQFVSLLNINESSHSDFMHRVARDYGFTDMVGHPSQAAARAPRVAELMKNIDSSVSGIAPTIGDLFGKGGFEGSAPKTRTIKFPEAHNQEAEALFEMIRQETRNGHELAGQVARLHEISSKAGIKVRLNMLTRSGTEIIKSVGLVREVRQGKKLYEYPLTEFSVEQLTGDYFVGDKNRRMVGRYVGRPESQVEAFLKTLGRGEGITKEQLFEHMVEPADVGMIRRFVDDPDAFTHLTRKKGADLQKAWILGMEEDAGKPLLPWSVTEAHNARTRSQASLGIAGYKDSTIDMFRDIMVQSAMDPGAGISPDQQINGIIATPSGDYLNPLGQSHVGALSPKASAQSVKPTYLTGKGTIDPKTGRPFMGVVDPEFIRRGQTPTFVRTFSHDTERINKFLSMAGRSDYHLHDDEFFNLKRLDSISHVSYDVTKDSKVYKSVEEIQAVLAQDKALAEDLTVGVDPDELFARLDKRHNEYAGLRSDVLRQRDSFQEGTAEHLALSENADFYQTEMEKVKRTQNALTLSDGAVISDAAGGGVNMVEGGRRSVRVSKVLYDAETQSLRIEGIMSRAFGENSKLFGGVRGTNKANLFGANGLGHQITAASILDRKLMAKGISEDERTAQISKIFEDIEFGMKRRSIALMKIEREGTGATPQTPRQIVSEAFGWGGAEAQEAYKEAKRYSILEGQGAKKIEERGMETLMESLFDRLSESDQPLGRLTEYYDLIGDADPDDIRADIEAEFEARKESLRKRYNGDKLDDKIYEASDLAEERLRRVDSAEAFAASPERYEVESTLEGLGYEFDRGRRSWTAVADHAKYNPVHRMDALIEMAMNPHGWEGGWSPAKFLEDMKTSKAFMDSVSKSGVDLTQGDPMQIVRDMFRNGTFSGEHRSAYLSAIEKQLQHGSHLKRVADGSNPIRTAGIGREASMNLQVYGHLRQQGGVMENVADDVFSRIDNGKYGLSQDLSRREAVNMFPVSGGTVSIYDLGNKSRGGVNLNDLFGINQGLRSQAFDDLAKNHELDLEHGVTIDLGEEAAQHGDRYVHLPRQQNSQSGGFVPESGEHVTSPLDKPIKSLAEEAMTGPLSMDSIATAASEYKEIREAMSQGKTSAVVKTLSGKVQGSASLLARSTAQKEFFDIAGVSGYEHKMGIRESTAIEQWQQLGLSPSEIAENLEELKEGMHAALIGREPAVSLQNFSATNLFSIDEVARRYVDNKYEVGNYSPLATIADLHADLQGKYYGKNTEQELAEARSRAMRTSWGREFEFEEEYSKANPEKYRQLEDAAELNQSFQHKYEDAIEAGGDLSEAEYKQWEAANKNLEKHEKKNKPLYEGKERIRNESVIEEYKKIAAQRIADSHSSSAIMVAQRQEIAKTADYDGDTIQQFMIRSKEDRHRAALRAQHDERLWFNWQEQFSSSPGSAPESIADLSSWIKNQRVTGMSADAIDSEQDFLYSMMHRRLAKHLKSKDKAALTAEHFVIGSKEWMEHVRGKLMIGYLEKKEVGTITNAVNYTREQLRRTQGALSDAHGLAAEAIMAILPESSIKAQQHGSIQVTQAAEHVMDIRDMLNNHERFRGMSMPQKVEQFRSSIYSLHKIEPGGMIDEVINNESLESIISAAGGRDGRTEDWFTGKLRSDIDMMTDKSHEALKRIKWSEQTHSVYSELARDAAEGIVELPNSSLKKNIKNAALTFDEVKSALGKHKTPLIIGAGIALATSMLLASPGNISSDEANNAGAKHRIGEPTTPPTDKGHSVSLSPGAGQNVKIRGRSSNSVDIGSIGARIRQQFSGSDISMNVGDYRQKINEDYIRRRIERT